MFKLYDYGRSGNCYKVRLLLHQLDLPFACVAVDIRQRETQTEEFVAKNPNRRVPVLEWPDGRRLAESNAILCYLAEGTALLPDDRWHRAQVLQWLFWEQYDHEPTVAVARAWCLFGLAEERQAELLDRLERGYRALGLMEQHLQERTFLVAERYTIADIALYAYTHVADEGGFDLQRFPALRDWLARVRAQPRHRRIDEHLGVG